MGDTELPFDQPGQGYQFLVCPDILLEKTKIDELLYAYAKDDIGREYRSEEGALVRSLKQLNRGASSAG